MYDHHGKLSRFDGGNLLVSHSMRPHSVQLTLPHYTVRTQIMGQRRLDVLMTMNKHHCKLPQDLDLMLNRHIVIACKKECRSACLAAAGRIETLNE